MNEDLAKKTREYESLEASYRGYEIMAREKIESRDEAIAALKEKLAIVEEKFELTQRERNDATYRVGELERVKALEGHEASTLIAELQEVRDNNKIKDNLLITRKSINDSQKEKIDLLERNLK